MAAMAEADDPVVYASGANVYHVSYELPFERDFDPVPSTRWMQQHWTWSIVLSVLYVAGIELGQRAVRLTGCRLQLRLPLCLWNAALAAFSVLGCARMSPEFTHVLWRRGLEYSICNASFAAGVSGFWTEMFAYSKVVEFGDTLFMVMRGRPVSFLHWFHHVTVLMYTWHAYKEHTAAGRWFVWMNYLVHAVMYTYYLCRAAGLAVHRAVPLTVTTLQLVQMLVGCAIAVAAYRVKAAGRDCQQSYHNLAFSAAIYLCYFVLFVDFFVKAYLRHGGRHSRRDTDKLKSR